MIKLATVNVAITAICEQLSTLANKDGRWTEDERALVSAINLALHELRGVRAELNNDERGRELFTLRLKK